MRNSSLPVAVLLAALTCTPLLAQAPLQPADSALRVPVSPASPLLPEGHWAVQAAARMKALGLATRYLPAQRAVPRTTVADALREAAERAPELMPEIAGLAQALDARFAEEFGERTTGAGSEGSPALLRSTIAAGYEERTGFLNPGIGLGDTRVPASEVPAESGAFMGASVAARVAPFLAAVAQPEYRAGNFEWAGWDVIAGAGPISLSIGRQPIGYGIARGGGVVLSETVLDRVQIQTVRPLRLPGPFRGAGPVSFHAFVSRFSERRHAGDPFFFGMRGAIEPHPRLTLAVQRASMFGGDSVAFPVTARNVGRMLVGIYGGTYGFENQVVSAGFRYRLPTEALLPVTVHGEWGADDSAGAWRDVPAWSAGLWVPALPGLPQVTVGAERASFASSCCGNPEWYRHFSLRGHWVAGDRPLGHPIGGSGSEWLIYGGADLLQARLHVGARAFTRDRGIENLFAPERTGDSRGLAVDAVWRVNGRTDLHAAYYRDAGQGWSEQGFQIGSRILF